MPDTTIAELAADYWEARLQASPTLATYLGDHRFDDQIEDLSEEGEAAQRSTWARLLERVEGVDRSALDQSDRVTLGLLHEELRTAIEHIDLRLTEMAWDQMDGVHAGLMFVAGQLNAPTPDAAQKMAERYRKVGTLLDQAIDRFRKGVAAGRTPPRIVVERSLNMVDGYLASPVEKDDFVTFGGPQDWDGEAAWRDELLAVARDIIRPGFQRYRDAYADLLEPVARPDERGGLQWLDDGEELYAARIRFYTSLDLKPEEIHAIGMDDVTVKLPAEYADVGGRLFGATAQADIFERLRTDPALFYANGDEIMDDAKRTLDAAKAVMDQWFGRLPVAECDIKPVPEHLAPDSAGAYYFSPAPDGSRPGTYFVNTYEPDQKPRYETVAVAFHEAIPGHHLQLAIATELSGLPDFQRFSTGHVAYAEGWGLYAERLAAEMGLYTTDLDRVGMLSGDSLRSCRLVVDTGLHALGWSRQQAIDFMVANIPTSEQEVTVEVDRYLAIPAQALAYKIGQREIFRLRAEAQDRLGDRFDIKGFHDTVLGSSLVTLPILGELVDDWVSSLAV
jgi:uncharacterized protein (DUF885 family)